VSLKTAAASGVRLKTLEQLRDYLASAIEGCDSLRDLSSLSGRLQSVLAEIDELTPKEQVGDGIDEIAARRSARRSGPATSSRSADIKG
jgi:hypothetical protein